MAISLYLDQHIPKATKDGLRLRGVDCLTAFEDNASTLDDPDLLDRATSLGRALVTSDKDFLVEADRLQAGGVAFAGVIYVHPIRLRQTLITLISCARSKRPTVLGQSHFPSTLTNLQLNIAKLSSQT